MRETLSTSTHPSLKAQRSLAARLLDEMAVRIERLLASDTDYASLHIRVVVDHMCILNSYLSLLLELDWELDRHAESGKTLMLELFRYLYIDQVDPMDNVDMPDLIREISNIS